MKMVSRPKKCWQGGDRKGSPRGGVSGPGGGVSLLSVRGGAGGVLEKGSRLFSRERKKENSGRILKKGIWGRGRAMRTLLKNQTSRRGMVKSPKRVSLASIENFRRGFKALHSGVVKKGAALPHLRQIFRERKNTAWNSGRDAQERGRSRR